MQIFESQCKKNQYALDDAAKAAVRGLIEERSTNSISFGNARGVRNVFERVLVEQANRLSVLSNPTREDLMAITAADVEALRERPEGGACENSPGAAAAAGGSDAPENPGGA